MPIPDTVLEFVRRAERLGLETAWVFDHVIFPHRILESLTILAALGAVTTSIRLGTGVLMLPVRNLFVLAKQIASIDYMTKGRIDLGVAIGGGVENFDVWKIDPKERSERLYEGIVALNELWTKSPASFAGRYFKFEGAVMEPKPIQKPHVPIWIGGYSNSAMRLAALKGDGYIGSYNHTPELCKQNLEQINSIATENSRNLQDFRFAVQLFTHIDSSAEKAKKEAELFLTKYYKLPLDEALKTRGAVVGDPAEGVAKLRKYVEAGVNDIIFITTTLNPAELDVFANEIIPSFLKR